MPTKPNKQKALLADFSHTVPMGYLHEKTEILIETEDGQLLRARTDMDGHHVSPNYGKRTGNTFMLDKESEYINVVISLVPRMRFGSIENTSIYARDNQTIHVRPFTHRTYLEDLDRETAEAESAAAAKMNDDRVKALKDIESAKKLLTDAENRLKGLTPESK